MSKPLNKIGGGVGLNHTIKSYKIISDIMEKEDSRQYKQ